MLQHRCPWCGERLLFLSKSHNQYKNAPMRCPKCKNICVTYREDTQGNQKDYTKAGEIIVILMLFLWIPFRPPFSAVEWWKSPLLCMVLYFCLCVVLLWFRRFPYGRGTEKGNKTMQMPSEKPKAAVCISWEPHKNKGLLYPKLQVPNGEIFPACFMDTDGHPISTALCVVIEDITWTARCQCVCNIQFVLDDVSAEELFQKNNTFNLYHNKRLIAKGIVQ